MEAQKKRNEVKKRENTARADTLDMAVREMPKTAALKVWRLYCRL